MGRGFLQPFLFHRRVDFKASSRAVAVVGGLAKKDDGVCVQ